MTQLRAVDPAAVRTAPLVRAMCAALSVLALALSLAGFTLTSPPPFRIHVLSNRPDMLSGGDALIRIDVPDGVELSDVRVTLNKVDVTNAFHADAAPRALIGLVQGMVNG